ncbi:hypothetical protein ACLBXM_19800 [Xanthobacteraceae bacterium A53D]
MAALKNQRVSNESPTTNAPLEGVTRRAPKALARPRRASKPAASTPILYAVYDGHDRLGSVRGEKAIGFTAHDASGAKLGHFGTIKAAADRLGPVTGGDQ